MSKNKKDQYTLITNVSFISFQKPNIPLRINTKALLITEEGKNSVFPVGNTLRGFGTEACADYFQYWLPEAKSPNFYQVIQQVQDNSKIFIGVDDKERPLFYGALLRFGDNLEFFLQAEDHTKPIDVYQQEGDICKVWTILFNKVIQYWKAPYMPHNVYTKPQEAQTFNKYV